MKYNRAIKLRLKDNDVDKLYYLKNLYGLNKSETVRFIIENCFFERNNLIKENLNND